MIEVYIVVVTCIGIFVSRQSAFYYQVCFTFAIFVRYILRMSFQQERPFMGYNEI